MTTRGSLARGQGQQQYQGNVQKWIRQWVEPGSTPGSSKVALLKWVPTGDRTGSKPGPRFPHLQPVSDPNLKSPAGQKDKGKKPVARQPDLPVQPLPMDIDSGQAATAERPAVPELPSAKAAAITAAAGAASALPGFQDVSDAARQPAHEAIMEPSVRIQQPPEASSDQLPTAVAVQVVQTSMSAVTAKPSHDCIALGAAAQTDPTAEEKAAAQPEIHTVGAIFQPQEDNAVVVRHRNADAVAEPVRDGAEAEERPVAQVEGGVVPSRDGATTGPADVAVAAAVTGVAAASAIFSAAAAQLQQPPAGDPIMIKAATSEAAEQLQQPPTAGPGHIDAAGDHSLSGTGKSGAELEGPKKLLSSKRPAEALEMDLQPFPKRSKDDGQTQDP